MVKKKFIRKKPITQKVFVAVLYLFSGAAMAQNSDEIKAIKKETQIKSLNKLQKNIFRNQLSEEKLKKLAQRENLPFKGEYQGRLFQLKSFDTKRGLPKYYTTYNADAAKAMQVDMLHGTGGLYNLDGQGLTVHEWDGGGVLLSHQEFNGRVIQKDNAQGSIDHATHVAGTMVASGVNPTAKGMLPKATLHAYEWTDDATEMIEAAANGAIVSNHSYGNLAGFEYGNYSGRPGWHWMGTDDETEYTNYGRYDSEDAYWDVIIKNAPYYLPVRAAGNSRGSGPDAGESHYVRKTENGVTSWVLSNKVRQKNGGQFGYDTVTNGTVSKNILVVGAAQKRNHYNAPSQIVPSNFTAFGPTDDGRIKPDIMGIGVDIFSTLTGGNQAYAAMSGTSMAAPGVTAAMALFQQHYKNLYGAGKALPFMKATTLKALSIHTAKEAGDNPGPDYANGWGLLDALKAVETISFKDKYSLIEEKSLQNASTETISVVASGNEPIKVTIAWNDPAPIVSDTYTLNDRTPRLVNDLDLRVSDGTSTFLPWKLDPNQPNNAATKGDNVVDNVEQVVIENPVKGQTYSITISHKGNLKDNEVTNSQIKLVDAQSQDFSIVVTGINQGVSKDVKVSEVKVPTPAEFTEQTPVTVKIENIGSQNVSGGKLKYQLINADENNAVVSENQIDLEDIPVGNSIEKTFQIDLSKSFVNYVVTAEVIWAEDQIADNNKFAAKAYGLIADLTKPNSRYDYGFETSFEQNGWTREDHDSNNDSWDIFYSPDFARTGNATALNFPGYQGNGTDDWLFSNPLKLTANKEYRIVFHTRNDNTVADTIEPLTVAFGKKPESAAMTKIGETIEVESQKGFLYKVLKFTPSETGIYHIGFHHQKDQLEEPYGVVLEDISFQYADSVPMPEFTASKINPNTVETVTLTAQVETPENDPITEYEWIFEPSNSVKFLDNTTKNSPNPKVSFGEEIFYNITLKAKNSKGEGSFTKKEYIKPVNVPVNANFIAGLQYIYQTDIVSFSNASTGNPEPETFKWTITPSTGFEFVDNTSDTSKEPKIKFLETGKYSIKLEASNAVNSKDELEIKDIIEVRPVYGEVRNLAYTFDATKKTVELKWDKPAILPIYAEGFERVELNELPADFTQIDEDGDGRIWRATMLNTHKGRRSVASIANNRAVDTKNWLITGKVSKGMEELKFWKAGYLPQGLEVYFVPANSVNGTAPTLTEIKNHGQKIYDQTSSGQSFRERLKYEEVKLDLSLMAKNDDFFIAFLHKKKKEDIPAASTVAHFFHIDEIEIGYKDTVISEKYKNISTGLHINAIYDKEDSYGRDINSIEETLYDFEDQEKNTVMAVLPYPRLVGYEVEKNAINVKTTTDTEDKAYTENILTDGIFVYDVYAVYSDGEKSIKQSITLDTNNLSTSEVKDSGLKIYPNPSDGRFVIEAKSNISSLKAEVYDMSGKLIFKNDFKGNKADLNLTQYPKGVYILNIVDSEGNKHSAKLMIK